MPEASGPGLGATGSIVGGGVVGSGGAVGMGVGGGATSVGLGVGSGFDSGWGAAGFFKATLALGAEEALAVAVGGAEDMAGGADDGTGGAEDGVGGALDPVAGTVTGAGGVSDTVGLGSAGAVAEIVTVRCAEGAPGLVSGLRITNQ